MDSLLASLRSQERIAAMIAEEMELMKRSRDSHMESILELRKMVREMSRVSKSQDDLFQSACERK